ncbi:high mobility group B protein 3 [Arachis stenosperma]|uniref:high mobility group B protein 3 n=1 Tax=Arachis stenosperma TaxID=217475 RepID=UPI0025AB8BAD|nr:high mobility group B protein 3 [Arachis stenosperma]
MAARPRARKRVFPLLRAPDGSAFQKCGTCGVSVAIALADIHDCEHKMEPKRFRGMVETKSLPESKPRFFDQPRSAFPFFAREQFAENHQLNNLLMVERMGFEKWKSMNDSEKFPYVFHARVVDGYYKDTLRKEAEEIIKVDDEAESALVENLENNDGDKAKGKVTFIDSD